MRKIALGLAALIAVAFVVPSYGAMDRPAKRVYREEFPPGGGKDRFHLRLYPEKAAG